MYNIDEYDQMRKCNQSGVKSFCVFLSLICGNFSGQKNPPEMQQGDWKVYDTSNFAILCLSGIYIARYPAKG